MRKPERKDIPGPEQPETIKVTTGGGLGSAPSQPEPEPEEPKEEE